MYPFERLLHELKKDVKNKARVEGSIANAYLVREASIFCSHYFEPSVHTRNRKVPRNDDGGAEDDDEEKLAIFTYPGRPYGKLKSRRLNDQEFDAAHSYILVNEEKVQPYLNEYETMLKELIPDISEQDLAAEVDKSFASWFENYVLLQVLTQILDRKKLLVYLLPRINYQKFTISLRFILLGNLLSVTV
ncbi:hypothetical protein L2E82_30512 [Cichorium intybus]|uniref:Uncharacterized protein n=1 Tax=Cichorium intybus TaxID=13427 RepID=A0ACB9D0H9_CICIN|nr:hypothetical protein L2E82_30512 [Cichorium intybus]